MNFLVYILVLSQIALVSSEYAYVTNLNNDVRHLGMTAGFGPSLDERVEVRFALITPFRSVN